MPRKRQRELKATRARSVTIGVAQTERDAVLAFAAQTNASISDVMRAAIRHCMPVSGDAADDLTAYLSTKMPPDMIEDASALARAAGVEPLTWLRYAVLAYVRAGSGDVLARQLNLARKAPRAVPHTCGLSKPRRAHDP